MKRQGSQLGSSIFVELNTSVAFEKSTNEKIN